MEMNIFKNEKQRILFFRKLDKSITPFKKILIAFKIEMEKINWKKMNRLINKLVK